MFINISSIYILIFSNIIINDVDQFNLITQKGKIHIPTSKVSNNINLCLLSLFIR